MAQPIELPKKVYKEQGLLFTVRRSTVRVREEYDALVEKHAARGLAQSQRLKDYAATIEDLVAQREAGEEGGEVPEYPAPDKGVDRPPYFDIFAVLTDGPHDELDPDEFDELLGERVMQDFFTHAEQTMLARKGILPFPG